MIVSAPAKINLSLRILGKRPDGFHSLESVMQLLALADTLSITEADVFSFSCSIPALNTADNLVVRAAMLLQELAPKQLGAHIHLEKRIPIQAGLGGGSSDAAATLLALNDYWELHLPREQLSQLAATLGSDVPFFLHGPCALVRGRGEQVLPVVHNTAGHVVLIKPAAGLSTSRVYAGLQAQLISATTPVESLPETTTLLAALASGNLDAVISAAGNDLEAPALTLLPELRRLRECLLAAGCLRVILCGSGSTLCGLCDAPKNARQIAQQMPVDMGGRLAAPPTRQYIAS